MQKQYGFHTFTVTCTSNIDSACTLNLLPHTYMYMLCFYYSGGTESFLIEKRYKGCFLSTFSWIMIEQMSNRIDK